MFEFLQTITAANTNMFLYIIPFIALTLFFIWKSGRITISKKVLLTISYSILFLLLAAILAEVSIESYVSQQEQASLTILVDNSSSMKYHNYSLSQIQDELRLETTTRVIASGATSPLNSKITGSLYKNGQFLLISDGYATDKNDLSTIVETASAINATINVLELDRFKNDASIVLFGPPKTFVGTTNTYVARINGNAKVGGELKIYLDGDEVYSSTDLTTDHSVSLTFTDQQTHLIHAQLNTDDLITQNNDYYVTTRIIPKPRVLYFGQDKPLQDFASQIFDVTKVTQTPDNMDDYSAAIFGNADLTPIDAAPFETFVGNGGGLLVFGGNNAYDYGKYDAHNLAALLPVEKGKSGGKQKAIVVIALDISASTDAQFSAISNNKAIEIQKAIAYSIVKELGDDNVVGIIAFNTQAYVVSELVPLSISRKTVLDKIERIQMQGNTRINIGLGAAYELLKKEVGTSAIVLITDGLFGGDNDGSKTRAVAKKLVSDNIKLFPVGVGSQIDEGFLRQLATDTDGLFLRPTETDRLAVQFGKVESYLGQKPTNSFFIDSATHPITFGLNQPTTQLNNVNQVIPKTGANVLVKSTQGDPALTIWNYGLGRVGSWTAFEGQSDYKEFLNTDSLLFGRLLTWGAGDPELKNPPLFVIEDTTLGQKAKVSANAVSIEELAMKLNATTEELQSANLEKIDETLFSGSITSRKIGFNTQFGQTFAVNYAPELTQIGQSAALTNVAKLTNGQIVSQSDLANFSVTTTENTQKIKTQKSIQRELTIATLIFLLIHILIGKKFAKTRRNKRKK